MPPRPPIPRRSSDATRARRAGASTRTRIPPATTAVMRTCCWSIWPAMCVKRRKAGRPSPAHHDCPYCEGERTLTIVGAQAASLSSMGVGQFFGSRYNADKKLITFSDSVQDAAHRAGFFGSRTWILNLRPALAQVIHEASEPGHAADAGRAAEGVRDALEGRSARPPISRRSCRPGSRGCGTTTRCSEDDVCRRMATCRCWCGAGSRGRCTRSLHRMRMSDGRCRARARRRWRCRMAVLEAAAKRMRHCGCASRWTRCRDVTEPEIAGVSQRIPGATAARRGDLG